MANSDLIQSLLRGLDILTAVGASPDGARLHEVAKQLGLKMPTAHNLVRTLLARDYLRKKADGTLCVGPAVTTLHEEMQDSFALREIAKAMEMIVEAFPAAIITFAEPVGGETRVMLRLTPERPMVLQRPQGSTYHLYGSASGMGCLAFSSHEVVDQLRERFPFYEYGAHLWETPVKVEKQLEEIRQRGIAELPFTDQEVFRIAVPIWQKGRHFKGMLGMSNRLDEHRQAKDKERSIALLKHAADMLATQL